MMSPRTKKVSSNPLDAYEQSNLATWQKQTGRQPGECSDQRKTVSTLNTMKHGIYASRFLTPDEQELFEAMIERFHEEYALNGSADFMQLELVCLYYTQLGRAVALEDWQTADRIDGMIRRHLSDLKATKRTREGEAAPGAQGMSATDWANQLLQRVKARKEEADATKTKTGRKKTPETLQRTPVESEEEHA